MEKSELRKLIREEIESVLSSNDYNFGDLSPETVERYNKTRDFCPYCNSNNIEWKDIVVGDDPKGDHAMLGVECKDCEREWQDTYKFDSIEQYGS